MMTIAISLLVLSLNCAFAQYQVKGTVVDINGQSIIGAAVLQEGTMNGTETDLDGNFVLTVPSSNSVLLISCVGYVTLKTTADKASKIILTEDQEFLDEVVVIGYGTVKKSDMTGSVSTVKADQVNKGMISSPSDLLKGKSAGIVVTAGNGQPGSSSTIRIRGGSSLNATNDPLIVVDGLPISNVSVSGVSDQLSSINPNDIESFTVLKDASATAIYGSRASNGVIIITTKKGSKYDSSLKVSADFTASLSQNAKYLDVMTGDEMRAAMAEYAGVESAAYAALGNENTDWQKEIYQLAKTYDGNISVSGMGKLGKVGVLPYRVSGGYLSQQGTLKTSEMDRGTLGFNLSPQLFDNHLTVNLNGKGTMIHNTFANSSAVGQACEYDPTQPITSSTRYITASNGMNYTAWGTEGTQNEYKTGIIANTQATSNPLASLYDKDDKATAYRFIGNAQFDYKIHGFEDLRLNLNLGIDYSHSTGTVESPMGSEQSLHSQTQSGRGYLNDYSQTKRDETLEFYANYNKTLGKHSIDAMAGYSWQHFYNKSDSYATTAEASESSRLILTNSKYASEYFLVSFFGRVNYGFADRYMLTATVRYDGTSRFSNNKWGLFPSIAFSWNAKNEAFLKDSETLSALKVRLSYGQTGQQDLNSGDYPTLATYKTNYPGSYYYFGDKLIIPITPLGYNADLKWETTTTYNVGLDYGFLKDRITGSVDVYYRKTTDLLNHTPVAAGANLSNYLDANIGTLENKGVEFEINFIPVQTREWFWSVGFNAAYNENEITKLTTNDGEGYKGVATGGISGGVGNTIQRFMVGYPVNTFYVYEQIYDQDGTPIMGAYVDRSGDGKIDESDLYCYKQAAPKVTLGFNTNLTWKNWSFAASAHANIGNYVYDNNSSRLELLTDLWTNNFVANRMATAMTTGFTEGQYLTDYYVHNASFFKLDNVTLGYTFNLKKGMNLNIFGTVQNVLCISKYDGIDPEIYSGIDNMMYPRPRTYILGLKFNF